MSMRFLLNLCSICSTVVIFCLALMATNAVYRRIRYKEPIIFGGLLSAIQGLDAKSAIAWLLLAAVVGAGIVNEILSHTLASTQIGAFYEYNEYEETYEATVDIDGKAVFCIVDMQRVVDREEDCDGRVHARQYYRINDVYLPYGKTLLLDDEYTPGQEGFIKLDRPIDETSFDRLQATVVTAYGPFCGSRNGHIYHRNDCMSAGNINMESKVFFASEDEAVDLGYSSCQMCFG